MRKRLRAAVIFIAVATGLAVGGASAAGATEFGSHLVSSAGIVWDLSGSGGGQRQVMSP